MKLPRIIRCGCDFLCGLYDGVWLAPPVAEGINAWEAYAQWKHLARLGGHLR